MSIVSAGSRGCTGLITAITDTTAAQLISPGDIAAIEPGLQAILSILAVVAFGGAFVQFRRGLVDRSIDSWLDRPGIAIMYGVVAYVLAFIVLLYGGSQLARIGAVGQVIGLGVGGAILLSLSGLGFTVLGTGITDIQGIRQPGLGLAIGAGVSGLVWIAFPFVAALVIWILLSASGIGGLTRVWFHSERTIASEREAE